MQGTSVNSAPSQILPGIEHVVVVMLENRSFDSTLGWLYDGAQPQHFIPQGACFEFEGLSEAKLASLANPLTLPQEPTKFYPPRKGATYSSEGGTSYLDSPPTDPHEECEYVTDQVYGPLPWSEKPPVNPPLGATPTMKGFLQDYVSALPEQNRTLPLILKIMETYTPDQLPVLCGLARAFACSDMWFSSVPTQTNPNRAFLACGTSLGQINNAPPWSYGDFDTKTLWNRLREIGTSWKIFWEEVFVPIKDSDMGWTRKAFKQLRDASSAADFPNMAEFHRRARNGTLPAVSFIEPSWCLEALEIGQVNGVQGDDYHPPGDVRPGEDLLAQIYTSLLSNGTAFAKTLLVITFDEHGGTFDHEPPPRAVPPDDHRQNGFDFSRYGVRVPTIFVSPRIADGTVIRAGLPGSWPPFDHTSVGATLLKWKGLTPSEYGLGKRMQQAPTFEAVLNRATARAPETLVLGAARQAPAAQAVNMGDRVRLRYVSNEKYAGWWLGRATWSSSSQAYYPTLTNDVAEAIPLFFSLGSVAVPSAPLTHGSFVYLASSESAVADAPYWMLSLHLNYERSDIYYAPDGDPTVPASGLYFTLKLADPLLAAVGQPIHSGDIVVLENRCIPSLGDWLPGKVVPSPSRFDSTVYLKLTDDPGYAGSSGQWVIERVGD